MTTVHYDNPKEQWNKQAEWVKDKLICRPGDTAISRAKNESRVLGSGKNVLAHNFSQGGSLQFPRLPYKVQKDVPCGEKPGTDSTEAEVWAGVTCETSHGKSGHCSTV